MITSITKNKSPKENNKIYLRIIKSSCVQKIFSVFLALLVWHLASILLNQNILLASPWDVVKRFLSLYQEETFLLSLFHSFVRIAGGFFLGLILGSLLASLAASFKFVELLLWPYMLVIKSVPVASFIILALIFLSSSDLSIFISFLMVLPILYTNILNGIKSTDKKLLEMAEVFRLSPWKKFLYIRFLSIKPFLFSACSVALGLAWKAGIAAEVIGIPSLSIGERLYESKIYLNTVDLFAWTVLLVIISLIFEKLVLFLLKMLYRRLER